MTVELLVADDERLFRQSLKLLLERETDMRVVAEAGDGQEAVLKAQATQPDLALMDVRMPKMSGIKAARVIKALVPKTKILMLSAHNDDEMIMDASRAGAQGYILKDADDVAFLEIIRQACRGERQASPYLANLAVSETSEGFPADEEKKKRFCDKWGLSQQEFRILQLLSEGLSNEDISKLVHVSRETIKMHLKVLFQKLQVRSRTEAAVLGLREGAC